MDELLRGVKRSGHRLSPNALRQIVTDSDNLDAIFSSSLNPRRRQHIHLSPDEGTAVKVGTRHGSPVVLRVNTAAMHADGLPFWRADSGVWLTVPRNTSASDMEAQQSRV